MQIDNIYEDEYVGYEGSVYLNNWDCEVNVTFPSEVKKEYAEKCAEYMDNMDKDMKQRLTRYSYRYFKEMAEMLDDDDLDMPRDVSEEDILKYVYPSVIIVEEGCREDRIEFHVECNCDWEIEHGLEITISNGKILYVGSFNDNPPYYADRLAYCGFYDENDDMNMNYADKE